VALAGYFVVSTLKPQWLHHGLRPPASVQYGDDNPGGHIGYAHAAKLAAPAVVSISAARAGAHLTRNDLPTRPGDDDALDDGDDDGPIGLGSGVIVSPEGYVLTNNHVVEDATDIEVQLTDGRKARAEVIGTDPETDLAVLRIKLDKLPVMLLGEVKSLEVGDAVLAIGNPFNVGQTVTSGIVSALGRNQLGINTFENFIQTDAAINPGNSGGALVDAQGRLLGINTAIYSRSGGSLGIGFAIPISTAVQVMEGLLRDGQVQRGWIGVQLRELTPEFAEAFKLPIHEGVLISGVLAEGPAAKAGVKPGDVILQVGKTVVHNPAQLLTAISAVPPKSSTNLSLLRGQQRLEIALTVAQRPKPQ